VGCAATENVQRPSTSSPRGDKDVGRL